MQLKYIYWRILLWLLLVNPSQLSHDQEGLLEVINILFAILHAVLLMVLQQSFPRTENRLIHRLHASCRSKNCDSVWTLVEIQQNVGLGVHSPICSETLPGNYPVIYVNLLLRCLCSIGHANHVARQRVCASLFPELQNKNTTVEHTFSADMENKRITILYFHKSPEVEG